MNWDMLVVDRDRDMVDRRCMVVNRYMVGVVVVDRNMVGSMVGVVVVGGGVGGHIVVRLQGGQLMHLKCGECKERLLFIVFLCDLLHKCLESGCLGIYIPSNLKISLGQDFCTPAPSWNLWAWGAKPPLWEIFAIGNENTNTSLLSAIYRYNI